MADKRESILRASAQEIARHGIRGMRVADVAANAGVSTALLYYHFTDRTGLLDAALTFMTDRAYSYRSVLDTPGDSAWQRLLNHVSQEFQDDPIVVETTKAWNELRASAVYEPELREPVAKATAAWREEIIESIELAKQSGEIDGAIDSESNSVVIVALMEGLSAQWMCGELSVDDTHAMLTAAVTGLLRPDVVVAEQTARVSHAS
jgi:AcrR family transcriptional regulator